MNASNTLLGCPVILKVKSNETYHGIFVTCSAEFDVILECSHKIDAKNEIMICGRSIPKKEEVRARFFERENIVEMIAYEVDKDFALKCRFLFSYSNLLFKEILFLNKIK
jgi:hypothetical protein